MRTDADPNGDSYGHRNRDGDSYCDRYGNSYGHRDSDDNSHGDTINYADADADPGHVARHDHGGGHEHLHRQHATHLHG